MFPEEVTSPPRGLARAGRCPDARKLSARTPQSSLTDNKPDDQASIRPADTECLFDDGEPRRKCGSGHLDPDGHGDEWDGRDTHTDACNRGAGRSGPGCDRAAL